MTLSQSIATVGGIGYLRPAPGTWGSLVALPVAWGLWQIGGLWLFVLALPITFLAGWWATARQTRDAAEHDPSEIVIDEVAGQFIALLPVMIGAQAMGAEVTRLWPGWVAAFVLFRVFDIWKPGPIQRLDGWATPFGVMADDALAGLFAAIAVSALAALSHGVLM